MTETDTKLIKTEPPSERLIIALDRNLPLGVAANVAAHLASSMAQTLPPDTLSPLDFQDASGTIFPSISKLSYVIFKGKPGKLSKIRAQAEAKLIPWTAFLETMTGGNWEEQLIRTRSINTEDHSVLGVAMFGTRELLDPVIRAGRLSVWT